MNELKIKILEAIRQNDGQFSWYQLDRMLSDSGVDHSGKLMQVLRELVASELISTSAGANPAQPLYSITKNGTCLLEEAAGA